MIFFIVLITSLFLFFWQDLKFRHIHIILPVLTFLSSYFLLKTDIKIVGANFLFLLLTLGILILYMSLKNKQFLNPFKYYFGFGDLLFYLAVTPLFLLYNYIVFFVLSMLFAIVVQKLFKKNINHDSIPLAGFSSLLLLIILGKDLLFSFYQFTLINL